MQFDVTISLDEGAHTVDVFPLREDADAKFSAAGFAKFYTVYPFRNLRLLLDFCEALDLLVDPTYLDGLH